MTRGTTPTYIIDFKEEIDFSSVTTWVVTLRQAGRKLSIEDPVVDLENRTIKVTLNQEQTLRFARGQAELQVRGVFADGTAFASDIGSVPINEVLDARIIG